MRRLLQLLTTTFLLSLPLSLAAQTIQWARQFGSNRVEEAFAVAVAPNSVYVAGETFGSFEGFNNAGNKDAFVSKFDLEGNALWTRQFGSAANDTAAGVAADASGVYVVGFTSGVLPGQNSLGDSDAFVRKYAPNGDELWTRQFGTDNPDEALAAAVDSSGFYVAGRTAGALPGQVSGSLGQDDAFLRKYDPAGAEVWTRQFGTSSGDRGHGVAVHAGGVYIAGSTGGPLVDPPAGTDGFVRRYDTDGNVVWTRQIQSEGNGNDIAYAVAASAAGVYVTGDTTGTFAGQTRLGSLFDAWVRAYDLTGNALWTRQIGTASDDDYGYGVATAQNWVYIALYSSNQTTVLQRLDLNGGNLVALDLPKPDRKFGYGVATDGAAAYLAASKDGSTLNQMPQGDLDALALKIPHPPIINGISDAFTGQPGVAATTWIALYGSNLASMIRTWEGAIQGTQLPLALDGVSVKINGRDATIFFISPGQVNVLAPLDTHSGDALVTLTTAYGTSAPFPVVQHEFLPSFYAPFGEAKGLFVTAVALDGTLLGKPGLDPRAPRPPRPQEVVQFFASGFGLTNPSPPSDLIFVGAPDVVTRPRITIGGKEAQSFGNGNLISPGLYQFNLIIPDLEDGEHVIQAQIGTVRSLGTIFLSVRR